MSYSIDNVLSYFYLSRGLFMTYEEMIELIDSRVDYMTDVITDSDWFDEKVQEAVKEYLDGKW
tara:strand:+ start:862 stop:1050 length:189 start_codon:yes stop_codon:yes gene_type:complete